MKGEKKKKGACVFFLKAWVGERENGLKKKLFGNEVNYFQISFLGEFGVCVRTHSCV